MGSSGESSLGFSGLGILRWFTGNFLPTLRPNLSGGPFLRVWGDLGSRLIMDYYMGYGGYKSTYYVPLTLQVSFTTRNMTLVYF